MSVNQNQAENGGDDEPLTIINDIQIEGMRISFSSFCSDHVIHPDDSLTLSAEQMRAYASNDSLDCPGDGSFELDS